MNFVFRLLLLSILIFDCDNLFSQIRPTSPLAWYEFTPGLNTAEEIPFFNLEEIKRRKFDTVYIIRHESDWDPYKEYVAGDKNAFGDTLSFYRFDSSGHIIQKTNFRQLGKYYTSVFYDSTGMVIKILDYQKNGANTSYREQKFDEDAYIFKYNYASRTDNSDSIVVTTKLLNYNNIHDTVSVETRRFNLNRKLISEESIKNPRTKWEDDTGSEDFHFEYRYDSLGRLIFYRDYESNEYLKIIYTDFGRVTEHFNSGNNQCKMQKALLTYKGESKLTVTTESKQIVFNYLEKGSSLITLITTFTTGESFYMKSLYPLVLYCEVVYR